MSRLGDNLSRFAPNGSPRKIVKNVSSGDVNMNFLHQEMKRIDPRINKLRTQMEILKKQIPTDTSSIFDEMRDLVDQVSRKSQIKTEQQLIDYEISILKSKLLLKVDQAKQRAGLETERQLRTILERSITQRTSADPAESITEAKIRSVEQYVVNQQKRMNTKIINLEDIVSKASLGNVSSSYEPEIRNLEYQNDDTKSMIITLSDQLKSITKQIARIVPQNSHKELEKNLDDDVTDNISELQPLPEKIDIIKNSISLYTQDLDKRIKKFEKSIVAAEKKCEEHEALAQEIIDQIKATMTRVLEIENSTNELRNQIDDLSNSSVKEDHRRALQAVCVEMQAKQYIVRDELKNIDENLRYYSTRVPLFSKYMF